MKRLVYSPEINVYVKADSGIYDLSPYVVSCMVNRKINQVSPATVTFRNPNFMFTEYRYNDPITGTPTVGPLFHPMDPIVITMTRLRNRPVQVFTGFCDKTPYLQLHPGTATIEASCTLKRLLYTFWDPGLQFVNEWMSQHGWFPTDHGAFNIQAAAAVKGKKTADGKNSAKPVKDGGIGDILYSVLTEIGGWPAENVYIENLPRGIEEMIGALFDLFSQESETAANELQALIKQIVGSSSSGGGGGAGTTGTTALRGNANAEKIFNFFVDNNFGPVGAAAFVGNFQAESSCDPASDQADGPGRGIAQWGEGARWDACVALASQEGKSPSDLGLQLEFVLKELNESYTGVLSTVKGTDDLEGAVTIICTDYEAPAVNNISDRLSYAQDALASFRTNQQVPSNPNEQ